LSDCGNPAGHARESTAGQGSAVGDAAPIGRARLLGCGRVLRRAAPGRSTLRWCFAAVEDGRDRVALGLRFALDDRIAKVLLSLEREDLERNQ